MKKCDFYFWRNSTFEEMRLLKKCNFWRRANFEELQILIKTDDNGYRIGSISAVMKVLLKWWACNLVLGKIETTNFDNLILCFVLETKFKAKIWTWLNNVESTFVSDTGSFIWILMIWVSRWARSIFGGIFNQTECLQKLLSDYSAQDALSAIIRRGQHSVLCNIGS